MIIVLNFFVVQIFGFLQLLLTVLRERAVKYT